jgi:predicted secreted protein
MRVSIPPRLPAKASGMRKRDDCMPEPAAMLMMIGIMRATVPVLLTKAPIKEVTSITSRKVMVSLPRESAMSLLPVSLASPVCMIAPPTTKSPIIMMTMGEEKPASASAGVRIPRTRSAARAVSATMSALTLPQMNRATVITNMISVVVMCFFWLQIYGNKVRIKNLREEK